MHLHLCPICKAAYSLVLSLFHLKLRIKHALVCLYSSWWSEKYTADELLEYICQYIYSFTHSGVCKLLIYSLMFVKYSFTHSEVCTCIKVVFVVYFIIDVCTKLMHIYSLRCLNKYLFTHSDACTSTHLLTRMFVQVFITHSDVHTFVIYGLQYQKKYSFFYSNMKVLVRALAYL